MLKHFYNKLSNGLQVIRVPMPSVKSVTVLALANTGSRYETQQEQGIAHFFEHMVFKGTAKYPDAQILAGSIDAIGADFNAFTSKEYTGYYVKSASQHLEVSLDVVSDMLLAPKLDEADIQGEKRVILEEINLTQDTPIRLINNLFDQLTFDDEGLGHDILGTKEIISQMTASDFRRFLKKWYGLSNLVLIVAGDSTVVTDKLLDTIIKYFSKEHPQRDEERVDTRVIAQKDPKISHNKLSVTYKQTEQAHLVMGWPSVDRDDSRRYPLTLLSVVLGGNMSSRLFTEIREKRGLCYYVSSDNDFYHNTGIIGGSAGVDPNRIDEAISVMLSEFYAVGNGEKLITTQELIKAKDYITGTMTLSLEDSRSVAQFFGLKQILSDKIDSPQEVLNKLSAVTLDQVNSVAGEFIKPGLARLAIIGPFKSEKRFEKLMR
jgi:predicted Zn-dependent peptidase